MEPRLSAIVVMPVETVDSGQKILTECGGSGGCRRSSAGFGYGVAFKTKSVLSQWEQV